MNSFLAVSFRKLFILSIAIFAFGNAVIVAQTDAAEKINLSNFAFINGNWFDGKTFKNKAFYSVSGVFSNKKPNRIDETIDLKNGFVVPPFGEAHSHTLEMKYNLESFSRKLLTDGVFYHKNPNSVPRFTREIVGELNKPMTVDAVFSNGGLTAAGGHPISLYDEGLAKGPWKYTGITSYDNLAYYIINNENDLEAKWSSILAEKPDFIKTYLLFSEEYEKRRDDAKFYGAKGLNPEILKSIVKKARQAGLRVSTHINTATDFHNAVVAGTDEINHLPGRFTFKPSESERYTISRADAKLAARKNISVVPTYSLFLRSDNTNRDFDETVRAVQRNNLKLLYQSGVKICFGTDAYNATSQTEAFYLKELGVFSNLELLKMWSENTPQTIFPGRKIGYLKPGYEASFLLLKDDPLKDFSAVKNIEIRFKQGFLIKP